MKAAGGTGRSRPEPHIIRAITVVVLCSAILVGLGIWNASLPRQEPAGGVPEDERVSVFTLVSSGIVYLDPDTSEIVWKNDDGDRESIGKNPWRNPGTAPPSESTGVPAWRQNRDIVGNPEHDLVTWVETQDGERGDLVVVQASTGTVLARASVPAPRDRYVVIAAIDEDTVYFATPEQQRAWPDLPGLWIWIWDWSAGGPPENLGIDRYYNDVSAGLWAVYEGLTGVHFEEENRSPLSVATTPVDDYRTDFGSALSPDGRYWYGARTSQIVDTATGTVVKIPAETDPDYAWTGPAELTLTEPFRVCSATTGHCRGPAGIPPNWVCAAYDVDCGTNLPLN